MISGSARPNSRLASIRTQSSGWAIEESSTATITSPGRRPARAAADAGRAGVVGSSGGPDASTSLRVRAAGRAIATRHFAIDHRGPQGVLGAPIGRIDSIRVEQKGEGGGTLHRETGGKPPRDARPDPAGR